MTVHYVPLSSLAEINPRLPKEERENPSQPVSFIPMDSVSEAGLVRSEEGRILGDVLKGYTYFERGDVLLAKITPCLENGKAALADEIANNIGYGTTEFHVLRPNKGVDPRFLFHQVWNPRFRFFAEKAMKGAAGQKRVGTDFFDRYQVPDLGYAEQKRIAAILDKADAIRRKRQQAIQLADEFLRSVFLEMFGDPVLNTREWPDAQLQKVAAIRSGVTKGRNFKGKMTVHVPYMRVANVQDGYINVSDVQTIEVLADEVAKYLLKPGDLLLTEGGDPDKLGRGAVWKGEVAECIHQNHVFAVRPDESQVLPEFLSAQIASQRGKRYFLKVGKQTTGIATINKTVLSEYPAILPPLELQRKYVDVREKVIRMKDRFANPKLSGDELFASLSQRAFQGGL